MQRTCCIRQVAGAPALRLVAPSSPEAHLKTTIFMKKKIENHTYWDLRRWRIADKEIETKQYTGLCPYFDINKQKYIFEEVAANKYYYTFDVKMYYERIPDGEIAKNEKLKQNPYYN